MENKQKKKNKKIQQGNKNTVTRKIATWYVRSLEINK